MKVDSFLNRITNSHCVYVLLVFSVCDLIDDRWCVSCVCVFVFELFVCMYVCSWYEQA